MSASIATGGSPGMERLAAAPALSTTDLAEVLSAFNDVTERLHTSHEALRAEVARLQGELREANEQIERSRRLAALGEMAAGIAHEVRNPLGSIRLYARMLEQDLTDRPAERAVAGKIAGAVTGLDAVVGDVLAFAREMRVSCERASTRDLIERGLAECRDCAGRTMVSVAVGPGAEEVECDPALAVRALTNILRNAFEATAVRGEPADGGAERRVVVSAGVRGGGKRGARERCVGLSVRDTGPGVPEDVLPRMFNPFFTTRATGTGLGLSIVHRIMDAHGGRVVVSNARGSGGRIEGAVVELLFPAGVGAERPAGGGAELNERGVEARPRREGRGRVRIVEEAR